jgi:hypothetical protein
MAVRPSSRRTARGSTPGPRKRNVMQGFIPRLRGVGCWSLRRYSVTFSSTSRSTEVSLTGSVTVNSMMYSPVSGSAPRLIPLA